MLPAVITLMSASLLSVQSAPASRSSHGDVEISTNSQGNTRNVRSYEMSRYNLEFNLDDWNTFLEYGLPISYNLDVEDRTFGKPELSYDLDYFNYFTGPFQAASFSSPIDISYMPRKQLFFENIPHVKLLLENQRLRKFNSLPLNRLGSIRPDSPFDRELIVH